MDAKKQIKQFINPNWIPAVVMIVFFPLAIFGLIILLCTVLPGLNRSKKSIQKLEALGKLNQAALELKSPAAKQYMNGKLILTDNFVFCKNTGYVFTYEEFLWVYRHRFTQRVFLIPIKVTESLCAGTRISKPVPIASMGKDKMDQITNAILEIYKHNPRCLVGYSDQNADAFKQMR